MTQKEIKTGNKLIAEFMEEKAWLEEHEQGLSPHKELEYDSSWDWLMPVVEKIESLKPENKSSTRFQFQIKGTQCLVCDKFKIERDDFLKLYFKFGNTKLEATYEAVIAFIKWHNKIQNTESSSNQ